jgi:hypothetical protein
MCVCVCVCVYIHTARFKGVSLILLELGRFKQLFSRSNLLLLCMRTQRTFAQLVRLSGGPERCHKYSDNETLTAILTISAALLFECQPKLLKIPNDPSPTFVKQSDKPPIPRRKMH